MDENLDPYSVIINIDGTNYTLLSDEIYAMDSNWVFYAPHPDFWSDGDTVHVALVNATDVFGYPVPSLPLVWEFIFDYRPPQLISVDTICGSRIGDTLFTGTWFAYDSVSGMNQAAAYFTVNGTVFDMASSHTEYGGYPEYGYYILRGSFTELGFYDYDTLMSAFILKICRTTAPRTILCIAVSMC